MPGEMRAQPLDTTTYGGGIMQPDEEIQYAPRSRPVSFYDNFKVSPSTIPRVTVYVCILIHSQCWESITRPIIYSITDNNI